MLDKFEDKKYIRKSVEISLLVSLISNIITTWLWQWLDLKHSLKNQFQHLVLVNLKCDKILKESVQLEEVDLSYYFEILLLLRYCRIYVFGTLFLFYFLSFNCCSIAKLRCLLVSSSFTFANIGLINLN